jgi:cytochrome c biogenesis protein ResB
VTLDRALRFLAQTNVAVTLVLLVLLLAILGSCLPQSSLSVSNDLDDLARWERSVRERYGGLTDLLRAAGAFRWFQSPIFLLPTGLLVLAVLVCTVERWRGVWSRALHRPPRCSDATFDRAAHTAELHLPSATDPTGVVRKSLAQRGYVVRSEMDGGVIHMRGDRNRLAPLATLLTHAAVVVLVAGVAVSDVRGWREALTLLPGEEVEVQAAGHWRGKRPHQSDGESGLWVRNEGLTISHYADGRVAGYDAEVVISEGGLDAMCGHVRLNQPLSYRGVAFTLRSYTSHDEGHSVTLQAARDPGYGLVVVAGLLMFLGMTVSFNLPFCCIHVRIQPGGILRLAGRADRRAWRFEPEFAALVREIGKVAER